jgi:hypothetical protein
MGYRQPTLERSLKMISWQGFKQEDGLISFGAMKQQSSSMMRLSCEVDDSHMGFKREEKSAKTAIWFESLLGSEIPTKSHHKKDSMMLTRLRVGAWLLEAP